MSDIAGEQAATLKALLAERQFNADRLNALTTHCERMRRELDRDVRLSIAEALRRDPPTGETVLLHSVLFQLTGDLYHYERILHYLLLGGERVGPQLMHYTYWCMARQLFLAASAPEKLGAFGPCDLFRFYEDLVWAVARRWGVVPPRHVPRAGPIRRVAVLTNQFTNDQHQPSRDCFDYASRLQDDFGLDVAIINCNTMPLRAESLFVPPMVAELVSDYEGVFALKMFGKQVKMASFTDRAFSKDKLSTIVGAIDGYDPDLLVTFGGANVVGDLFAVTGARPVVCLPTTSGMTISLAHLVLGYEERNHTDAMPALYRGPFARRFRPFTLGFSPPPTAGVEGAPDLGDAAFVFAVVGTRLDIEVTAEFLALADSILDRCPGAVIVFAGEVEQLPARLKAPRNGARMRSLGHLKDIRAFYRRCHAYLNPSRQGGGGSAAYAIAEGLPVVTLAWGDVASVAGAGIPVPDAAAYVERAAALVADPALRERQSELSRIRFQTVGDRHRCAERLLAYGEEARDLLRAAAKAGAQKEDPPSASVAE
ncbi:glycosyl transferase family 1 [Azospirillum baldaniorum]|uniref:glycosyltransferase n=1 Tax=Azospirillum baldaniorum TaxID=1064539 RepID=UPI0011A99774|nr:glycosyltransferase [Azospirillum baldaniorum]TWA55394.1 glycosyl transferase family 1 [Azospirillum baldaniorum]